ncbi:hypothetical protein J437_LFUL016112 [Ladona fulva]|uniref:SMB domain-containing protein n=1 Tax=Ladona fulva TaxID=123851 RepID=A0A8K0KKN6_LADFU|nr:hypothetical protein J437_LFUL016112 [Ladona fulva]
MDDCSVPILGTLCYCDQFCDRGVTHDCCPDYWDVCAPVPPPEPILLCEYGGRKYTPGQTFEVNCNTCTCTTSHGAAATVTCTRNRCLLDQSVVNSLRRDPSLSWSPTDVDANGRSSYRAFMNRTLDYGIQLRLGTINPDNSVMGMQKMQYIINETVPLVFDGRTRWRTLSKPLDQGWCASSWALSAATVISDRAVIADSKVTPLYYEHFLDCEVRKRYNSDRCAKGHLHTIWKYLTDYGAPERACVQRIGSSEEGCYPQRRQCKRQRSGPAYRLGDINRIQDNIRWYGPVQATMRVYQDFFHYKSGVYSRPAGSDDREPFGYHSVRIIGWGEDYNDRRRDPIPYWLVANSWGEWWGEDGYFRIRRGVNECDIEKYVLGAWIQPELAYRQN